MKIWSLSLIWFGAICCTQVTVKSSFAKEDGYALRAGDHIEILIPYVQHREGYPSHVENIKLFGGESFTTERVMVTPGGKITLPILGELDVAGLTLSNVKTLLSKRLAKHTLNHEVYVILREVAHPKRVYVIGEVHRNGDFEYTEDLTMLKLIALAGGFTKFANKKKIKIYRQSDLTVHFVNVKQTLEDTAFEQLHYLEPEDVIVVTRSLF